jgi:methyl-accepting chemotaxis protein
VTLALFGLYGHTRLSQEKEEEFTRLKTNTITRLSIGVSASLWDFNKESLEGILKAEMLPPEIFSIQVIDSNNNIFLSVARGKNQEPVFGDQPAVAGGTVVESPIFRQTAEGGDSSAKDKSVSAIGRIAIQFSRHRVEEALRADILHRTLLVLTIDILLMILLTFSLRMVFTPLNKLRDALLNLADNDNYEVAEITEISQDEFGDLVHGFNQILRKVKSQSRVKTHVAELTSELQQAKSLPELAQTFLSHISPLLNIGCAVLYTNYEADHQLRLLASYGFSDYESLKQQIPIGESLIGQCAIEKVPIILITPPKNYLRIRSGLGESAPGSIAVLPIMHVGHVLGVLEVAMLQHLDEETRALLDQFMPVLATSLEILERTVRTEHLLEETQRQAENMEKQAARLEEQAVEMEAQQKEFKTASEAVCKNELSITSAT